MASCVEQTPKERNGKNIAALEEQMAEGARNLDPFAKLLQMEVLWATPHEAEGVMYVTPQVLNPYGTVHGGCLVTLADSVAGHNMAAAGKLCVTLSSTINFLNPAMGKGVRCHSRVQEVGKRIGVVSVEATDEHGTPILTGLFTFSAMKDVPPHQINPTEA